METYYILLFVICLFVFFIFSTLYSVNYKTAVIIERLGNFHTIARSGLRFKMPIIDAKVGLINLRIQQLPVTIETKTRDDVFIKIVVSVQYFVIDDTEGIKNAFYKLDNPTQQIQSYVFDTVRSEVPRMDLDDVFSEKGKIAMTIQKELCATMKQFGFDILKALVTDIDPDAKVKHSMNEINAAKRMKEAAKQTAESEKIKIIAASEAECESKRLQGEGVANQRIAIANGMKESVEQVKVAMEKGVSGQQIMNMLFLTQHYDTISKLSETGTSTIFMPYSPNTVNDLQTQIQSSLMAVDQLKNSKKNLNNKNN